MVETQSNKRRIAKNTIFLYIRMLVIMAVSLFTQRVVLDKLGASDYGIYYAVAGVVAMLGFLNGTLSTGTSRFLTYEIGRDNVIKLKETFSTAFYAHLILATIVAVVLLTGGIWFVENKLIIPEERLSAAVWVLVISVFSTFVSITQVPYSSVIIAHENMSIYAYIGLFEAGAKLGIVYLLALSKWDKLVLYAVLVAVVQVLVALYNRYYCARHYDESHIMKRFDRQIFNKMMSFSSWNLITYIAQVLGTQGLTVLMNMFFMPVVVAAQAIGNQISGSMMGFVNNFRTAINPQVIKLYAARQYEESSKLTLQTSVFVHELLLLLCLPLIVFMKPILDLWLVEVPEYAVVFSQYIVAAQILGNFNGALYTPMIASGRLKENSFVSVIVTILGVLILYFLLKFGCDVLWVQYFTIAQSIIGSFIVKPILLCKYIPGYRWKDFIMVIWEMLKVSVVPITISILIYKYWPVTNLGDIAYQALAIVAVVILSSLAFMDKIIRKKLFVIIETKIHLNKTNLF